MNSVISSENNNYNDKSEISSFDLICLFNCVNDLSYKTIHSRLGSNQGIEVANREC